MKRLVAVFTVLGLLILALGLESSSTSLSRQEFEALALQFSEPSGFFDTDNLISNETSYQHVVPFLYKHARAGGAYLGVGPDQNFTYIAQVSPAVAFVIDIRRDNQLLYLYYKQLFEEAENRWDFLSLLLGRPLSADFQGPVTAKAGDLVDFFQAAEPNPAYFDRNFDRLFAALREDFPRLLQPSDRLRLYEMTKAFLEFGLELRFRSHGRPPRFYYPTLGELVLATDLEGKRWNYLAGEESFQSVRKLQLENRVIPVVGDFSGNIAFRRLAEYLRKEKLVVSTFYLSNVEFYLFRDGRFEKFLRNVESLPVNGDSLLIRSFFRYGMRRPPGSRSYFVNSFVQSIPEFLKQHGKEPFSSYWDLMTRSFASQEVPE